MELLWKVFICLLAGIGAGLGTGFAGMSAACVITPLISTFLGLDTYEAIGIALASDVLASGISALTYGKNKNIDIKNGLVLLLTVVVFTVLGSYVSKLLPEQTLGTVSVFFTLAMGVKFIVKPITITKETKRDISFKRKTFETIVCGMFIGFVCGFVGAGGGIMLLMALTLVIGYDLKTAVGTSVFVMSFTAFTGAISHFSLIKFQITDIWILVFCVIFTLIFAQIGALIANKSREVVLNRVVGIILIIISLAVIAVTYIPALANYKSPFAEFNVLNLGMY